MIHVGPLDFSAGHDSNLRVPLFPPRHPACPMRSGRFGLRGDPQAWGQGLHLTFSSKSPLTRSDRGPLGLSQGLPAALNAPHTEELKPETVLF